MKIIPLSQNKKTIIDNEEYKKISKYKWSFSNGYAYRNDKKTHKTILLHRFIMGAYFGDKKQVDHINHNGLDNRKENLRICTHQENCFNRLVKKNRKTKGVYLNKRTKKRYAKKWQAGITLNQKLISLGYFTTISEAAKAYNEGAKKYFGEFAYLNKIKKS